MRAEHAPDVQVRLEKIVHRIGFMHIDSKRIVCMRSTGSKSRAYARIWSLPRIWQKALGVKAHYVVEVLNEKFDKLSQTEQDRTLIHELLHIPKTFSGALVQHKTVQFDGCGGFIKKRIDEKAVSKVYELYLQRCAEIDKE